jgi:predicted ATPase/DNA-binding CsgD family transcriptional regulator
MSGLRTRLPFELTSFIGREHELAHARDLLQQSRLVTLTGPGGCGKTRLALELASEVESLFEDAAVLVELSSIEDRRLVPAAIAEALGLAESARDSPEEAVVSTLETAEMLLVLDNCEHLVEYCSSLVERLLRRCGQLRVLATSRQALEILGEVVFTVPPLSLPPDAETSSDVDVMASEAVRLFADRAARSRPGFAMAEPVSRAVVRICQRLDGLPLGIELAAARVRSMSPDEILTRLDDRFALLATHSGLDPRHPTMRSTIDWSHDLLDDHERAVFRRLATFSGGWTLEDAEAVCSDATLLGDKVVAVHSRLIDKSLVVAEPGLGGPTRHRMLETVREYAAQRLAQAGEADQLRTRHFEHFLKLAEDYYSRRHAGGSDAGLEALAIHRDNFRTALSWAVDGDLEGGLRLASALDDVWRMVGAAEGWRWLELTLPSGPRDGPYRVRALLTAGMLAAYVPAYAEGAGLLAEAAALAEITGDRTSEAWAELWLGRLALFGDATGDAEQHLDHALTLHTSSGNVLGEVRTLALLGLLGALAHGRTAEAVSTLGRAVELAKASGDVWGEGYAELMLGLVLAEAGRLEGSAAHFRAALRTPTLGPILGVPMQGMARARLEKDAPFAVTLLGAAAAHFERTGTLQPGFVRRRADAAYERGVQLLGSTAAAAAFVEGRRLSTETATRFALDGPIQTARPGGLTMREAEVASLVAQGLANRDVAATLFISVRTVESHLDHVLNKLGLHNRTQLASWAHDHPLEFPAGIP